MPKRKGVPDGAAWGRGRPRWWRSRSARFVPRFLERGHLGSEGKRLSANRADVSQNERGQWDRLRNVCEVVLYRSRPMHPTVRVALQALRVRMCMSCVAVRVVGMDERVFLESARRIEMVQSQVNRREELQQQEAGARKRADAHPPRDLSPSCRGRFHEQPP